MRQWLGLLGVVYALGTSGCDSNGGGRGTLGAAGSAGSAGAGGVDSGAPPTEHVVPISSTGFMQDEPFGVQGAWYSYGDGIGSDGTTATGDCVVAGHMLSECALIATPPFGVFDNTGGAMHTSGTVEPVLDLPGMAGNPDYTGMWGAGIGCDLNNPGTADGGTGMKGPYDAAAHQVVGISFELDTPDHVLPSTGLRVEFPTPSTKTSAHVWLPAGSDGNYVSPLAIGKNTILFATDVIQPDYVKTRVDFDPSQILSVQWHVPTKTATGASYDFTIDNFSFLVPSAM